MTKKKEEYVELTEIDWINVIGAIALYPLILAFCLTSFFVILLFQIIKLTIYLVICITPIFNISLLPRTPEFFEIIDDYNNVTFDDVGEFITKQVRHPIRSET